MALQWVSTGHFKFANHSQSSHHEDTQYGNLVGRGHLQSDNLAPSVVNHRPSPAETHQWDGEHHDENIHDRIRDGKR
jgi:hypothetical protein